MKIFTLKMPDMAFTGPPMRVTSVDVEVDDYVFLNSEVITCHSEIADFPLAALAKGYVTQILVVPNQVVFPGDGLLEIRLSESGPDVSPQDRCPVCVQSPEYREGTASTIHVQRIQAVIGNAYRFEGICGRCKTPLYFPCPDLYGAMQRHVWRAINYVWPLER